MEPLLSLKIKRERVDARRGAPRRRSGCDTRPEGFSMGAPEVRTETEAGPIRFLPGIQQKMQRKAGKTRRNAENR